MGEDSEHFQPFANGTPLFLTNEELFSFADITISPRLPFLKFNNMGGEGLKVKFWGGGGEREDLMKLAIKKKKKIGTSADLEKQMKIWRGLKSSILQPLSHHPLGF